MTSRDCHYTNSLIRAYPNLKFKPGRLFSWYAAEGRICFEPCTKHCQKSDPPCTNFYKLAHELGHAELGHEDYKTKIELNRMELAAWAEAERIVTKLNPELGPIPEKIIDAAMQSYINFANQDECPNCSLSLVGGICPNCQT